MENKFTKQTLNAMLERIVDEYFSDEEHNLGLWEIIEYVKVLYSEEINTLNEGENNGRSKNGNRGNIK